LEESYVKFDVSQDPEYLDIAADIIGVPTFDADMTYTIGVFDAACEFQAVILFNNWEEKNVSIHIASVSPKWATREVLKVAFTYAFLELGVQRVTGTVRENNTKARALNLRLGFKQEGVMRQFYDTGESDIIFGMTKDECKWI